MSGSQGYEDVKMLSQITATFSVGLCVKSEGSAECRTTKTHVVHAVGVTHTLLGKLGSACGSDCKRYFFSLHCTYCIRRNCCNTLTLIAQMLLVYLIAVCLMSLFCCHVRPGCCSPFLIQKAIQETFKK